MEAHKRCVWRQTDHEFFDTFEFWAALLIITAQARLFGALVEDDIANALNLVRQNADTVRLVAGAERNCLPVPLWHIATDGVETERLVDFAPETGLQPSQVVVPRLVVVGGDGGEPLAWPEVFDQRGQV